MTSPFSLPAMLQLIVVVSSDWDSADGQLYRFQRAPEAIWELIAPPIAVNLGERGMSWGRGLIDLSEEQGAHKRERDQKSPAGLFSFGQAFGDELHRPYAKKIPYILITEDLECVDDPTSTYYNQFVHTSSMDACTWNSSEKMIEIGPLYALGVVIQHNADPIEAGLGSAIFMHVWSEKGSGTAGCTAMELHHLEEIVAWLDMDQHPCLMQLPMQEYRNKMSVWGLPELPN